MRLCTFFEFIPGLSTPLRGRPFSNPSLPSHAPAGHNTSRSALTIGQETGTDRVEEKHMRLWSIHPHYLDVKGLVACWREGLLARKVLQGLTKGYWNHPQLDRFRGQVDPVRMMDTYLLAVYEEATRRGYKFNREKIGPRISARKIAVTDGQLRYELRHLKKKLRTRNRSKYSEIANVSEPEPHPIFRVVRREIETWERSLPDESLQE